MAISAEKHQGTRQVFLWLMACTYLFAFASLYTQIPGRDSPVIHVWLSVSLLRLVWRQWLDTSEPSTTGKWYETFNQRPFDIHILPQTTLAGGFVSSPSPRCFSSTNQSACLHPLPWSSCVWEGHSSPSSWWCSEHWDALCCMDYSLLYTSLSIRYGLICSRRIYLYFV